MSTDGEEELNLKKTPTFIPENGNKAIIEAKEDELNTHCHICGREFVNGEPHQHNRNPLPTDNMKTK